MGRLAQSAKEGRQRAEIGQRNRSSRRTGWRRGKDRGRLGRRSTNTRIIRLVRRTSRARTNVTLRRRGLISRSTCNALATRLTKLNATMTPTASRYSARERAARAAATTAAGPTSAGRCVTRTARSTNARKSGSRRRERIVFQGVGNVRSHACSLQERQVGIHSVMAAVRPRDGDAEGLFRLAAQDALPHREDKVFFKSPQKGRTKAKCA